MAAAIGEVAAAASGMGGTVKAVAEANSRPEEEEDPQVVEEDEVVAPSVLGVEDEATSLVSAPPNGSGRQEELDLGTLANRIR